MRRFGGGIGGRPVKEIKTEGHAKINLALEVVGLRPDGYHEVRMFMQQIALKDIITVRRTGGSGRHISITCNKPEVPTDHTNLAYKAAMLMLEMSESLENIEIEIEKHIPMEAGLAGGSADCAAVLKAMNDLFEMHLGEKSLCSLGAELGADVPFCIVGGAAMATGTGTEILPFMGFAPHEYYLVLCKPPVGAATREVYAAYDLRAEEIKQTPRPDAMYIAGGISMGAPIRALKRKMVNDLEYITGEWIPEIRDIEALMTEEGAVHAMMTGSGPTVVGIFENKEEAAVAFSLLSEKYNETYITTFA